jgi:hypothetical protein
MAQKDEQAIRQEIERRLQEIQLLEQEAKDQGRRFRFLSEDGLTRKVRRESLDSPFIFGYGWNSSTTPGASATVTVSVANPDPTPQYPVLISLFFDEVSNFLNDVGLGPAGRNLEWPYLSTLPFSLASGGSTSQSFSYHTPTVVTLGTYLGNLVLWRGDFFDQGTYLDRAFFEVTVA